MATITRPRSRGTTSASTPSEAAAPPSVPVPAVRRLQVPQLALGLVLSGAAALGFVLFTMASTARVPVIALAEDVVRGQTLTAEDLQVVQIATDDVVAVTPAAGWDELVGRVVASDLPAGALLSPGQVTTTSTLMPGRGVVGLALAPGGFPTGRLAAGDLVNVVQVAEERRLLVDAAEVVEIEPVGTQGERFVSLLMDEALAEDVAEADATGQVRLVLIDRTAPPDTASDDDGRSGAEVPAAAGTGRATDDDGAGGDGDGSGDAGGGR
jgi:hypothetical protein